MVELIKFACVKFRIHKVIKCGFGLTRAELDVFLHLLENEKKTYTTNGLAKETGLKLTTIQKAVKKLNENGVLEKKQANLDNGGYVYKYSVKSFDEIRKILKKLVKDWAAHATERLDEKDLLKQIKTV